MFRSFLQRSIELIILLIPNNPIDTTRGLSLIPINPSQILQPPQISIGRRFFRNLLFFLFKTQLILSRRITSQLTALALEQVIQFSIVFQNYRRDLFHVRL